MAACDIAEQIWAAAVVVFASTGRSARKIACYRPREPIAALTDSPEVARQPDLSWGVLPQGAKPHEDTDRFIGQAERATLVNGSGG